MIFAALGHLSPVQGALLQEVIDIVVVLNALRAFEPDLPAATSRNPVHACVMTLPSPEIRIRSCSGHGRPLTPGRRSLLHGVFSQRSVT